ncbi:MAG: hypothetical protein PF590_05690 [Candidatus Delongbacteria bacterium]|jgi:hypothetical protein|nr:hypothetical protein [Candidatus Delongbacteria bacterium]
MKIFISVFFSLCVLSGLMAQDIRQVDSRLLTRFSETQIQQWEQNDPNRLDLYEFEVDNGYDIRSMPLEKLENVPELYYLDYESKSKGEKVQSVDEQNFNLYLYNYKRDMEHNNHYRIAGTNKVLVIYSNKKFVDMFNESRNYEK